MWPGLQRIARDIDQNKEGLNGDEVAAQASLKRG
jgi:hypothetical protein